MTKCEREYLKDHEAMHKGGYYCEKANRSWKMRLGFPDRQADSRCHLVNLWPCSHLGEGFDGNVKPGVHWQLAELGFMFSCSAFLFLMQFWTPLPTLCVNNMCHLENACSGEACAMAAEQKTGNSCRPQGVHRLVGSKGHVPQNSK